VGVVQLLVDAKANLNGTIGVSTAAVQLQTTLMLNSVPAALLLQRHCLICSYLLCAANATIGRLDATHARHIKGTRVCGTDPGER
jgi:hypothetical protein